MLYGEDEIWVPDDAHEWYDDMLRLILPHLSSDQERGIMMHSYYYGYEDITLHQALSAATRLGIRLPKKFRAKAEELALDADYADLYEESVDFDKIFAD